MRKQFSITGDNRSFKRTLIDKLSELQEVYKEVMEHIVHLKKANTYFSSFMTDILGSDVKLTMLQFILSNN